MYAAAKGFEESQACWHGAGRQFVPWVNANNEKVPNTGDPIAFVVCSSAESSCLQLC